MPQRTVLSELSVNAEADAFAALMNGGFLDFYDGVPPKNADTAVKGQTLGVSLAFGSPAFMRASAGVIIANPIAPGVAVARLNPVTWARIYRADHRTAVMDVSVGTEDATIVLPTVDIGLGVLVTCSNFSHKVTQ